MGKLRAALDWAARGFRVFPLQENSKKPLLGENWPAISTTDPAQIARWWRDDLVGIEREYNVGVDTTGFLVVDLDNKDGKNGEGNFRALGGGIETLAVRTPSGGYHLYYDACGLDVANTGGTIADGIDTRGHHGYVLAPGSSIAGIDYRIVEDRPLGDAPRFVWERLKLAESTRRQGPGAADTDANLAAASRLAAELAPAVEGAGGDLQTYRAACAIRDVGVTEWAAGEVLAEHWNPRCSPPWDLDELRAKVGNAYAYAQRAEGEKSPAAMFGGVSLPEPEYVRPPQVASNAYGFGNLMRIEVIPARPWVVHRMLLRGEVTALIAPGGAGKSQFILTTGIHLALGTPHFFGFDNAFAGTALRTLVYDSEDSLEEMSMRIHATCIHQRLDVHTVRPCLSLNSGKAMARLRVTEGRDQPRINELAVRELINRAVAAKADVIALGPLSKLHDSNENDNTSMGFVIDTLELIARMTNAAVLVQHHTAKPTGASSEGFAGSMNSGRGAKNIVDSVRAAFTLDGLSEKDAIECGIPASERERYIRLDDAKMNRTLRRDQATYIYKASQGLPNGETVGVFHDTDLNQRRDDQIAFVAEILKPEFISRGVASMGLMEAAAAIKAVDPIHGAMSDTLIKSRIHAMFRHGFNVPSGGTLQIKDEGSKKVVAFY